jgi:DNA-binding LacI/PurR family transcriptional regulator
MRQPMSDMGALAVQRLFERMRDPAIASIHKTFVPTLVVRRTCGSEEVSGNPLHQA